MDRLGECLQVWKGVAELLAYVNNITKDKVTFGKIICLCSGQGELSRLRHNMKLGECHMAVSDQ